MAWSPLPTSGGRPPAPVSGALEAVMASLGGPSVQAIVAVHQRWGDIVGAEVALHAEPLGIDDGRLRVQVDGSAWASHLRWAEPEILVRLAEVVGVGQVTTLVVSVGRR